LTPSTPSHFSPGSGAALTAVETSRYSRHIQLHEIGEVGQLRLKESHVILIGVGGLGSPAAQYLAAAGVGRLTLVDDDTVDLSNLQRQTLFTSDQIEKSKITCAAERLSAMNDQIEVRAFAERFTVKNALDVCADANVLIDCSDNLATRYLASDVCARLGIPYVYGSVAKFEGMVAVFDAKVGPCYRCLHPLPPAAHAIQNCADAGVLGVLPAVVGSIQATEALKLILGIGKSLLGRLLTYDALQMSFSELRLPKNPDCRHCGPDRQLSELQTTHENDDCAFAFSEQISATELSVRLLSKIRRIQLVDVRSEAEWKIGHLRDSIHLPLPELAEKWAKLESESDIIFICRSGMRSDAAVRTFRQLTGRDSFSLTGGLLAWRAQIAPSFQI